jgi:signal transduction histidine kinase
MPAVSAAGSGFSAKILEPFLLPRRLSGDEESRLRAQFLPYDIVQIRLALLLTILPNMLLAFNDHQFLGHSSSFYVLLFFRFVTVLASVAFIIFLGRIKNYMAYDRAVSVWLLLVLITIAAVNLTRPAGYYMHVVIDVLFVLVVYVIFLSRFLIQLALALALSIVDLTILFFVKDIPTAEFRAVTLAFVLANGLGWLILLLINRARRHEFLSHEAEIKALDENRRLEAEHSKQSRLETVGMLADAVAADFKGVLTRTLEHLDSVVKAAEGQSLDEMRLNVSEARSALYRGTAVCNQLLVFTRGDDVEKNIVNLEHVIRNSVYSCLDGTSIPFTLHLDFDICPVEGDRKLLMQAFSNILGFVKKEKPLKIKVRARNIALDAQSRYGAGPFILTQVEDEGQGVDQSRLEHLFDPLDSTPEKNPSLDMPLAYSIVKKHGGGIDIESIPGGGTIFFIYLPAMKSEKAGS